MEIVVGLGEILWDLLPSGKQLGGAPANFAYHAALLGHRSAIASRVGEDALGREIRDRLTGHPAGIDVSIEWLQADPDHATGTVDVVLGKDGQPSFTINEAVAWDHLAWPPSWQSLAGRTGAVCFGSLAQRSRGSQATIRHFVAATGAGCLRVFDVNLRQRFYSEEILRESLHLASVAKLNDDELPIVAELMGVAAGDEASMTAGLRERFGLAWVVVTRGARGAILAGDRHWEHPGFKVTVADTVGAGDAFTAALTHHLLAGSDPEKTLDAACRMGAWVASCKGATPSPDPEVLAAIR